MLQWRPDGTDQLRARATGPTGEKQPRWELEVRERRRLLGAAANLPAAPACSMRTSYRMRTRREGVWRLAGKRGVVAYRPAQTSCCPGAAQICIGPPSRCREHSGLRPRRPHTRYLLLHLPPARSFVPACPYLLLHHDGVLLVH